MTSEKKPIIVCEECGRKCNTDGVAIHFRGAAWKRVSEIISQHEDEPVRIRLDGKTREVVIEFPDFSTHYIR